MHDGPAQSLTNIALQAQIVQRLVARYDRAVVRSRSWWPWCNRTLEATKTFIFDVRPMVLDDPGIVPTLRRTARDGADRPHPGRVRPVGAIDGWAGSRERPSASSTTPSLAT
jgi:two-component system sensor histidine kinase DegS